MRDFVINLVREGAQEMYDRHGHVSAWHLSRNIHIAPRVISEALLELGFVEGDHGNFFPQEDRGKAKVKKPECLAEPDLSVKVSNDMEPPIQNPFLKDMEPLDFTSFSLNELRSIASNKGIEVALSLTKGELIKKLKSNLK